MVGSMQELRLQTVAKNKNFADRCTAIEYRRVVVEGRLQDEVKARDEQLDSIRQDIEAEVSKLRAELMPAIEVEFHRREKNELVREGKRLDVALAAEQHAYQQEVPDLQYHISGEAVARMQRERYSFDLDNTKARAREKVLDERFQRWLGQTRQRSSDEREDRLRLVADVTESHGQALRTESRSLEDIEVACTREIAEIATRAVLVSRARAKGDGVLAEDLETVMRRLQAQVIESFGGSDEDEDEEG